MSEESVGTVAVFGAGYVGIPTAILFGEAGWRVVLVEPNERRRDEILVAFKTGRDVLCEPGTGRALYDLRGRDRIRICREAAAIGDAELAVICVGTPQQEVIQSNPMVERQRLPSLDHYAVLAATRSAWAYGVSGIAVVVRSTCSPGFVRALVEEAAGRPLAVVPEFLREGSAMEDARRPARVVVGNLTGATEDQVDASSNLAVALVGALGTPTTRWIFCRPEEAAAAKLAANAMLAERVAFGLRLARYVEDELPGCDAATIAAAVTSDPRIGTGHLRAGLGAGGPCLPKDSALWDALTLVRRTEPGSDVTAPSRLGLEIRMTPGIEPGSTVLVWGIGFKPESPDWRDSPAIRLVDDLSRRGLAVYAWDPRLDLGELSEALRLAPGATPGRVPCRVLVLCARPEPGMLDGWSAPGHYVWDPYALLGPGEVRSLVAAGGRYRGGGRGSGWAE